MRDDLKSYFHSLDRKGGKKFVIYIELLLPSNSNHSPNILSHDGEQIDLRAL